MDVKTREYSSNARGPRGWLPSQSYLSRFKHMLGEKLIHIDTLVLTNTDL